MLEEYLQWLACPKCQAGLELDVFFSNEASLCEEGVLTCPNCYEWYPIVNSVPRLFVLGPLRPDDTQFKRKWAYQLSKYNIKDISVDSAVISSNESQVQTTFGHKWTHQAWWGMQGETAAVMEEWLLPRYGWKNREEYKAFMREKKVILDAGCGLGREALRMAQANPKAKVIGLELSRCVDEAAQHAAQKNIRNILFVQADLMSPPFERNIFDFIISEGVLHHTSSTKTALLSLCSLVSSSGEIGFYIYREKGPIREFCDDYIREKLENLSPEEAWKIMEPLTSFGRALSDLKVKINIPEDISFLQIKAGEYDLQRFFYYSIFKCYWNERLSFDENVHVNFDWYHPHYAHRHSEFEVRGWISEMNMRIIHEDIQESGITIRCQTNQSSA